MNFQSSQAKLDKCRVPLNILSSVYENNFLYRRNNYSLVLCGVAIAFTDWFTQSRYGLLSPFLQSNHTCQHKICVKPTMAHM